jgi:hypothetical protein
VVEGLAIRRVRDDDDGATIPAGGEITQEVARLGHDLPIALSLGPRLVDVPVSPAAS